MATFDLDPAILGCIPYIFLCFMGALVYLAYRRSTSVYDNYEQLGNPWWLPNMLGKGPHTLFSEGYKSIIVPFDEAFVAKWWSKKYLILPTRYLPDLARVKSENASFLKNFSDASNSLTPLVQKEIHKALETEIGQPKEWKTFKAVDLFIIISHRVVNRILAGEELARNEEYIQRSHQFTESVFVTGLMAAELPLGPFRKLFGWLVAQYHRFVLYKTLQMVEPVVKKRMAEAKNAKDLPRYDDSIEWSIRLNADGLRDSRIVSLDMLHILQAGSGAPGAMMSEMMYQLLVEPHYIEQLKDEIREASLRTEDTRSMLDSLSLMDSFIMETNRMYPIGGVTAARTVMHEPWVLHDGTTLPVGTRIGFPCKAIQLDARNFSDPLKFDGHRFVQPAGIEKEVDGKRKSHSAATATPTNLSWGFGKHTCPGRFYAVRLAKMVFVELLQKYEFQWDGKPRDQHPPSFESVDYRASPTPATPRSRRTPKSRAARGRTHPADIEIDTDVLIPETDDDDQPAKGAQSHGGTQESRQRSPSAVGAVELMELRGASSMGAELRPCASLLIQDDPESVAAGIAVMDTIYQQSYFTIVATSRVDANAGLPGVDGTTLKIKQIVAEVALGVRLLVVSWLENLLDMTEYAQRAWTFQEYALAHRKIIFTDGIVYFDCMHSTWTEELTFDLRLFGSQKDAPTDNRF
ncbi:cytochrome P450 [Polyplosphaeria fusca]|uniref:Cytochrome P450 n=1 Tax=Polyplosphaeria fusca TaxID=682080 RepID=A0A9P4QM55_9PLEO|nr:cytochrome P450 [Polyplosphaeria fusca]